MYSKQCTGKYFTLAGSQLFNHYVSRKWRKSSQSAESKNSILFTFSHQKNIFTLIYNLQWHTEENIGNSEEVSFPPSLLFLLIRLWNITIALLMIGKVFGHNFSFSSSSQILSFKLERITSTEEEKIIHRHSIRTKFWKSKQKNKKGNTREAKNSKSFTESYVV